MRLKMIALDLDGTLLGGTKGYYGMLPEIKTVLEQAAASSVAIAFVTGRPFDFITHLLAEERVQPARSGWPRAIITDERAIYIWENDAFQPDTEWNLKTEKMERDNFARINAGVKALLESSLPDIDPLLRRTGEETEILRGYVELRFSSVETAQKGQEFLQRWLARHELPFYAVRNVKGVSIRHCHTGKGITLDRLCHRLGVENRQVLAVGDSLNDLSMLDGKYGYRAAAPGNADPEVKKVVAAIDGHVSSASFGTGVAEAINTFFAGEATDAVHTA